MAGPVNARTFDKPPLPFPLINPAGEGDLPRSASLCLREVLLVLQRFKAVVADCATRSRTLLLLQSDEMDAELRDLHHDLATLLDLLPVVELGLADDVMDLLALASRQCRRCASAAEPEPALKTTVLSLIEEIEREIVPERERLEEVLEEVGINDPASCSDEMESLERDIGDRASERWTAAMIALVGLLRYAKCVLFSATPRPFRIPRRTSMSKMTGSHRRPHRTSGAPSPSI